MSWHNVMSLGARPFTCGSCGTFVASERGYQGDAGVIYVCPFCDTPTVFLEDGRQIPGVAPVGDVQNLPPDVAALYREARGSLAASRVDPCSGPKGVEKPLDVLQ